MKSIKTVLITIIFFLPLSVIVHTLPSLAAVFEFPFNIDNPRWSISKLNGTKSFADGANCHNAVLTSKGYSDFLMYSDRSELRYFLTNFCEKNISEPGENDILVAQRYFMVHAGINLRSNFIFEKNNIEGQNERRRGFSKVGAYSIIDMSESDFFNECKKPSCTIDSYTCPDSRFVRSQIYSCEMLAKSINLTWVQTYLQQFTINSKKTLDSSDELLDELPSLAHEIEKLEGDEDCHLFIMVKGASVAGHLIMLNFDEIERWNEETENLKIALSRLRNRLLRTTLGKSMKFKKLFEESHWLSQQKYTPN